MFGSAFGRTPAPAAFGAAPATTSIFGQQQQQAPGTSLFGQPAAAPSAFGGFGQQTQAPAPFGQAPAPGTSLFGGGGGVGGGGAFGSLGTSTFGQPQQQQQQQQQLGAFGGFGGSPLQQQQQQQQFQQQQQQQQQLGYGSGISAGPRPGTSELENALQSLAMAYTHKNPATGEPNKDSRFKFLMYNIVGPTAPQYQCPPFVEQRVWDEAQRDNPDPDELVPALVVGFDELQQRVQGQQAQAAKMMEYIRQMREAVERSMQATRRASAAAEGCRRKHLEQRYRLLQVMQKIELLRCFNLPLDPEERRLRERLQDVAIQQQVVRQHLNEVVAQQSQADRRVDEVEEISSPRDAAVVFQTLDAQREGLGLLTAVVQRDLRDLEIMKRACRT